MPEVSNHPAPIESTIDPTMAPTHQDAGTVRNIRSNICCIQRTYPAVAVSNRPQSHGARSQPTASHAATPAAEKTSRSPVSRSQICGSTMPAEHTASGVVAGGRGLWHARRVNDAQRFAASLDVEIDLPLAGAGSRVLARAVDVLILFFGQLVLGVLVFAAGSAVTAAIGTDALGWIIGGALLVWFLLQWFLSAFLELWTGGRPPGKRMLGLRVVRDDGATLTLGAALLRNLLRLETIPGGLLVDLVVMGLRDDGRRLGDLAAGTLVVAEPKPVATRSFPPELGAAEVTLLETWFARVLELEPERRSEVAGKVAARIAAAHPGLLPDGEPLQALEALAPVRT